MKEPTPCLSITPAMGRHRSGCCAGLIWRGNGPFETVGRADPSTIWCLEGERLARAAELDGSGVSLSQLGKHFELDPKTVRVRLAESSVEIRSRGRQKH